ncbi:MAG: hypothetical protein A3F17_08925 [Gammaproteobacteria bacterium RIFCSPHIGHO2_12_FULL_41_15]|nr:MAG: hypothetical protein A3F17_08925 [Gammaproteobacteria bacterium RIFCSPHIGHO2_12_FULL_41_15]
MTKQFLIPTKALRANCDPNLLGFDNTTEVDTSHVTIGQENAIKSLHFGADIHKKNYHIFAMSKQGLGERAIIENSLKKRKKEKGHCFDWCYINNYLNPQSPNYLKLPAGTANHFASAMEKLVKQLSNDISLQFTNRTIQAKLQDINYEADSKRRMVVAKINTTAEKKQITIRSQEDAFELMPFIHDKVLSEEEVNQLSHSQKLHLDRNIVILQKELTRQFDKIAEWADNQSKIMQTKSKKCAAKLLKSKLLAFRKKFSKNESIQRFLINTEKDMLANLHLFMTNESTQKSTGPTFAEEEVEPCIRYKVNVMVTQDSKQQPPIIFEPNPNYPNLVGRIEHISQLGALVTNFSLIRPGALHRANGGYLIIDMQTLLSHSYAWEGLKSALDAEKITIAPLEEALGFFSTTILTPKAIPLDIKVILLGDQHQYSELCNVDPEFKALFRVIIEFEDHIRRNTKHIKLYAKMIASFINDNQLLTFNKFAVATVIDYCSQLAGDAALLSLRLDSVWGLLQEAEHLAKQDNKKIVTAAHVKQALADQINRINSLKRKMNEEIERKFILIKTHGKAVAQINALTVLQYGDFEFGIPSRVSAMARRGDDKILDIEREVELGGAIHSKGVLILAGYLQWRYVIDRKFSLSASLVFEQSYGEVDGDSASMAELCALLSAISGIKLQQSIAVTGSINQHGECQVIGCVNEKIAGFFDVCKLQGFSGDQGVIIPKANAKQLMLNDEIITAVKAKKFHIYAVETIDAAMEILTGMIAGKRRQSGHFTPGSINDCIEKALIHFSTAGHRK